VDVREKPIPPVLLVQIGFPFSRIVFSRAGPFSCSAVACDRSGWLRILMNVSRAQSRSCSIPSSFGAPFEPSFFVMCRRRDLARAHCIYNARSTARLGAAGAPFQENRLRCSLPAAQVSPTSNFFPSQRRYLGVDLRAICGSVARAGSFRQVLSPDRSVVVPLMFCEVNQPPPKSQIYLPLPPKSVETFDYNPPRHPPSPAFF